MIETLMTASASASAGEQTVVLPTPPPPSIPADLMSAVPQTIDLGVKIGQAGVYSSVEVRVSTTALTATGMDDNVAKAQVEWIMRTLETNAAAINDLRYSTGMHGLWQPRPTGEETPAAARKMVSPPDDVFGIADEEAPSFNAESDYINEMYDEATKLAKKVAL